MPYSATTVGGHVHFTTQDEPVVRVLKEQHGNTLFEVLKVEYARLEAYPIYHIRKVGTKDPILIINGRFLDDALESVEERLFACASNALDAYLGYMKRRGRPVDVKALLGENGFNN